MKTLTIIFISITLSLSNFSNAQLQNGAIAPNFTLMDINGNQHTLYDYLNQGKTVYIDFFACHCPYCWNYHSTHALSDLYDTYGPGTSSNSVFVFAIELDANNGTNEFYGISGSTQGNWIEGTNYPQINPEGSNLTTIISNYNVNYYPLIYAICPDKTLEVIGTQTTSVLYNHVGTCQTLGYSENQVKEELILTNNNQFLTIDIKSAKLNTSSLQLVDLTGRILKKVSVADSKTNLSIEDLQAGTYILCLTENGEVITTGKFQKF